MHFNPVEVLAGLVVLVGPPAAGKSTFVQELVRLQRIPREAVASTDAIRAEFAKAQAETAAVTTSPEVVVDERDRRLLMRLAAGYMALAESTNVTRRARARLITVARQCDARVTILRFNQSREILLTQNIERERQDVPDTVVLDLAMAMQREGSVCQLYSEGAASVHDVPGRGQGFTATEAAQLFTFRLTTLGQR
ncbi:AAA family ATPase [Streptomyces sp. NPDC046862]|uniref:AAA family ATPase n=1 Tax=Streptomyces sp. NPDC046862 TaxID=3154603 RepID=UPI003451283B